MVEAVGRQQENASPFLSQILTQNRKNWYGQSSTKGKRTLKLPCEKAPNGRHSATKIPRPILLSGRSGVRVPTTAAANRTYQTPEQKIPVLPNRAFFTLGTPAWGLSAKCLLAALLPNHPPRAPGGGSITKPLIF